MTSPVVLLGTDDGFRILGSDAPGRPPGRRMVAITRGQDCWWAVADGDTVWRHDDGGEGEPVVTGAPERLNCLLPTEDGLLVGAAAATLYGLAGDRLEREAGFDAAPGRDGWYTPWGGPPDVRSMAADADGTLYVNVHVGGVLRSRDGGHTWSDTMDVDNDVHEVIADPETPGRAHVAAAVGVGTTDDAAANWTFSSAGLSGRYCRAVTLSRAMLLVSGADGSSGRRAALYRRARDGSGPFERCRSGLPEWFSGNVDTFCLAASGGLVVAGDPNGTVYVSEDEGGSWQVGASGLPGVHCIGIG